MTASRDLVLHDVAPGDWSGLAAGFADLGFEQTLPYSLAAAARIGARPRFVALSRGGLVVAAAAIRVKTVPGLGCGIAWAPSAPLLRLADGREVAPLTEVLAAFRSAIAEREGHVLRFRLSGTAGFVLSEVAAAALRVPYGAAAPDSEYRRPMNRAGVVLSS